MRSFALIGSVGVLAAGLLGAARADGWKPSPYSPYTPSYSAPNCPAPGAPPLAPSPMPSAPSAMPSAPGAPSAAPGTPSTAPGTPSTAPGTPSTTPGAADAAPAPSMGDTAAGTGDTAGSALGESGSGSMASAFGNMIGDQAAYAYTHSRTILSSSSGPSSTRRAVSIVGTGAFKIAENESPRPQDRVYFDYNFYNNFNDFSGNTFDLHRATLGFEKTFMGGNASFGARIPVLWHDRDGGGSIDGIGDLSIIGKYAFLNDCNTGNVLSGGLVVTVPTGREIDTGTSSINAVLLQPYLGGIFQCNSDLYAQGFSSIVVPSDNSLPTVLYNDVGVGYRLYRCSDNSMITAIIPTVEGHLQTPINHTGVSSGGDVFSINQLTVTAGVHLGLCNQAYLTIGANTAVMGPRPYDVELIAQFNLKF